MTTHHAVRAALAPAILALALAPAACSDDDPNAGEAGDASLDVDAAPDTAADVDAGDDTPDADAAGLPAAPVTVYRDEHGTPHIVGSSRQDVYWAQGYEMAADRVVHMEFMRRRAYGTISELFGPAFLDDDRLARVLGLRDLSVANAEQDLTSCDVQRERCENYVRAMQYEGWQLLDEHFDDLGVSGGVPGAIVRIDPTGVGVAFRNVQGEVAVALRRLIREKERI